MKNILICFGTRPEYIKVKSLIDNMSNIKTCFTGQHKDLLNNVKVDYELNITSNISENRLNNILCNILSFDDIFNNIEYVMVQGDTTSALAICISAYHHKIKIIHLEAGLRTYNIYDPHPEEGNRTLISKLSTIHLCPTSHNKKNLLEENIPENNIFVVGNTGLDNISRENCKYENIILITMHRRDNIDIMDQWFSEMEKIATIYHDHIFIIPLHPNPDIQKHKHIFNNVKIINPLNHEKMIDLLKTCKIVISDSGGLQEECCFLNKKIIVCRKNTERPESLNTHSFICSHPNLLITYFNNIINDYQINEPCPYGDGKSWENVINVLNSIT